MNEADRIKLRIMLNWCLSQLVDCYDEHVIKGSKKYKRNKKLGNIRRIIQYVIDEINTIEVNDDD